MSILIVVILVNYVGMTYGPIGAFLAEFFPEPHPLHLGVGARTTSATAGAAVWSRSSRPRCTSPPVAWDMRLIYPIAVPAIMFLIAIFVMPETRKHSIWEEGAIEAARVARLSACTNFSPRGTDTAGPAWQSKSAREGPVLR